MIFSNNIENPSFPYLVKDKVNFVKTSIFWAKKVNMMPFFSDFERKYHCSHAYFLSKNRKISKKYAVFMPMFCQKTSTLSKTCSSHVVFSNFSWKTPAVVHMIGQKMSILSKLHSILGHKSQYDALFSYFSQKKLLLLCPYFVKKRSFSKKK